MSIRSRLLLLIIAIMLPGVAAWAWYLVGETREAEEVAYSELKILAGNVAENLDIVLHEHEAILTRLAARPLVKALDAKHCDPLIGEYVGLHPEFTTIGIRDLQGRLICSFIPNAPAQSQIITFPWFQEALRSGGFSASDAFLGRTSKRWLTILTFPIRDDAGELRGLVVFSLDLLKLNQKLLGGIGKDSVIPVLDRQNQFLLRSAAPETWIGQRLPDALAARVAGTREGVVHAAGVDGIERVYAVTTVPHTGWRVFAGKPVDEVLAPVRSLVERSIVIGAPALLLMLALVWWLSEAIAAPIRSLQHTAQEIGAGNRRVRASIAGPRELAAVAQHFNRMLDSLERQTSEREALNSHYASLMEHARDIILLLNEDGFIVEANQAALSAYGYSAAELKTLQISDLRPPNAQSSMASDWQASAGPQGALFETLHQRKDGSTFPVEISSRALEIEGKLYRQNFVRDISARKQATETLFLSEERFRLAMEASSDGLWDWDVSSDKAYFSPAYYRMLGYAPEEFAMLGKSWTDLVHPDDFAACFAVIQSCINNQRQSFELEFRMKTKAGDWKWILGRGKAFSRDTLGHALRLIGTHVDITERRQAEEKRAALEAQLRESQKMEAIGTLAGGVAHDFNNLLAMILGNVALARQDAQSNGEALVSLDEINKAAVRAQTLVQQILTFSRKQPHELISQPLQPAVDEALGLLRASLPAGIELVADLSEAPLQVRSDGNQIVQVLMNLCTNAWQSVAGPLGRIEVGLHKVHPDERAIQALNGLAPGDHACLSVSDNGSGMDEATQARIFEPFFTTKGVGQGTGLGLSVVHGIVKAHSGAIEVRSQPGQGTRVTVYLPLSAARPESAAPVAAIGPVDGAGQRVLYVDDEASLVLLVERMLNRLGYLTTGCASAEAAIAAVRAAPQAFDLVVTDYNMPGHSGLDVAREVKRIRPDLAVVISSGYITDELRLAAQQIGVSQVVYKPNTVNELCSIIHRLFNPVADAAADQ